MDWNTANPGAGAQFGGRKPRRAASLSMAALLLLGACPTALHAEEAAATAQPPAQDVEQVVVNGVPYRETVLPTRLSSSSVYGLDLNVMDTPRNTTLLSATQLETLNIQDPRAFSWLTASSYTDSAFGTPNIPRIRGQFADVFYNGMRSSFSQNGYGVPPNFDDLDTVSITKGPASVASGPGPGVGGEVDFITKRPGLRRFHATAAASLDTMQNRRLTLDVDAPLITDRLGLRVSYSGEDSDSYFTGHYVRKNAVYAALRWQPNGRYRADFSTEINIGQYTENVGVNRVSQALIDHNDYLTGRPDGELYSALIGVSPLPIGSAANPFSPLAPILTTVRLDGHAKLNRKTTIDQTPGTSTHSLRANAQLIQTWTLSDLTSVENNTFVDYQDSDIQDGFYYADSSRGSWTLENRTRLSSKYQLPGARPAELAAGISVRFAHVNYISDFSVETPSLFDLTTNPALWVWDGATQEAWANARLYKTPSGRKVYGVPARDPVNFGNGGVSNLTDVGLFVQQRIELSPRWSLLAGARMDAVQNRSYDPLGGPICTPCGNTLPQSHTTGVYGLGNANLSLVWRPRPEMTLYTTAALTQSIDPNGGEGGVNTFGQIPDHMVLRKTSFLYEAGVKLNLLGDRLFAGAAVFDQKRSVPIGAGGTQTSHADIAGLEVELNYQPTRTLFATASYSYIRTTLNRAAPFYNYPAEPGTFIDGAGLFAVFAPGQTFNDPGVPEHVFNVLINNRFSNGIGLRAGLQVTGPIDLTTSGQLDLSASSYVPASVVAHGGRYRSPRLPWQGTLNASVFYEWDRYLATLSVYNLTDEHNWQASPPFYGNDFLVRSDPRTAELRLVARY